MDLELVEYLDFYNMDEDRKGVLKNVYLDIVVFLFVMNLFY